MDKQVEKLFRTALVAAMLLSGCATVQASGGTPGNDPEPLAALLYRSPDTGKKYCTFSNEEGSFAECKGLPHGLVITYTLIASAEFLTFAWNGEGSSEPTGIDYVDNSHESHHDGRAVVLIDQVVVREKGIASMRVAMASDQHLFDHWKAWIFDQANYVGDSSPNVNLDK